MGMAEQFVTDATQAGFKPGAPATAPTSLADQFKADAAMPAPVEPPRTVGGFVEYLADQPFQAADAFGHHIGNFLHGSAQLIQNGITSGAEAIAPNSAAAKYLRNATDNDQAILNAREKEYHANVPDSPGSYAGAILGSVAPFVAGGGPGSISSTVRTVGDTVAKVPQYVGSKFGAAGKAIGDIAGSITSGATQGGILGATQIVNTDGDYWDQVLKNAKMGAKVGGGLTAAGQLLRGGYNAASSVLGPLTERGQDNRVAKFLIDNMSDPEAAPGILKKVVKYLQGSEPTTAQALRDSRLLELERAAKNTQPFGTKFDELTRNNNRVRVGEIENMAGVDGRYEQLVSERAAKANEMYGAAIAKGPNPKSYSPAIQEEIATISTRPSMQAAMADARKKAAEAGIKLDDSTSVQGLHFAKLSLDEQIGKVAELAQKNPAMKDQLRLLMGTKEKLEKLIGVISPDYAVARSTFAELSKPINQMEQARKITGKLESVPEDVSGVPVLTRARMATVMRQIDPSVLSAEQMARLQAIKADLNRADLTNTAQRAYGSNTPQDLTNLDFINSLLGKSTVLTKIPVLAAAGKALTDNASNSMQKKMAELLLDPEKARVAIQAALDKNANPGLVKALLGDPATAALLRNSPQYGGTVSREVMNLPYRQAVPAP